MSIQQAKSILEKRGLTVKSEGYNHIRNYICQDESTWYLIGLFTKFHYENGVDLDRLEKLRDSILKSKVKFNEFCKLPIDEIEKKVKPEIEKVGESGNYNIYWVKSIQAEHKIGSPRWCIKKPRYWDSHVSAEKLSVQYVCIRKDINLRDIKVPNDFSSDEQSDKYVSSDPDSRIGITTKYEGFDAYDDGNNRVAPDSEWRFKGIDLSDIDWDIRLELGLKHNKQFFDVKYKRKHFAEIIFKHIKGTYETVNNKVNVTGDVFLSDMKELDKLPFKFGKVSGSFKASNCNLKSLENMPDEVGGDFTVSNNPIDTLQGAPLKVSGHFMAANCHIETLGIPDLEVGGNFTIINNKVKTLIDGPWKVGGSYICDGNQLQNLIGMPDTVKDLWAGKNKLINLDGCPEVINGHLELSDNKLSNLKGGPRVVRGRINLIKNPLTTNWKENLPETHGEIIYDGLIDAKVKIEKLVLPAIPSAILSSWNKLSSVKKNEILATAIHYELKTDADIQKWWFTRGIIVEEPVKINVNTTAFAKIEGNI